ncbi:uncharacterized protein V6R79_018148 [Siganus canaliculatus]
MRLTVLCLCGTLLAFLSLSWTTADSEEGQLLGDNGFGPCAATLRPEGPCRQGQDESTCPYLFSLPPLTVYFPNQLKELDEIVKDLQSLKDNVDQLRKMCADCTVSQTESECGRQREKQQDNIHKDERNWLDEFSQECGANRVKTEKTMEGDDSEKIQILDEKGRNKWEAEMEEEDEVIKENEDEETLKEVAEKYEKHQKEVVKGKDRMGKATVPAAGGNERIADVVIKRVAAKNDRERETDTNKDKKGKGNSKVREEDVKKGEKDKDESGIVTNQEKAPESNHHVWQDETKEREQKAERDEDKDSDGRKMSEDHDEHTNKEKKEEVERGIKVEQNYEKPKQIESVGHTDKETTIKEAELEEDRETGNEMKTEREKTVQSVDRDEDEDSASSKATQRTDFVSISPTPLSTPHFTQWHGSTGSNTATTFTSSLPPPSLSRSTSFSTTETTMTAEGLPTQRGGPEESGLSERPHVDAEVEVRTKGRPALAPVSAVDDPRQQGSPVTSTGSDRPETTSETTTAPRQNSYTLPGLKDRSHWAAKKNVSSNTDGGVKPLPDRGLAPRHKHKTAVKPEGDRKLKNSKTDRKTDSLPEKKTKPDQRQKPTHQKSVTHPKSTAARDSTQVHVPKRDQKTPQPDQLPLDQNLLNIQTPKQDQNQIPSQEPHEKYMLPVQRTTSPQRPQTVNKAGSDKDLPTNADPEPAEIPVVNQKSKPDKKPVDPLKVIKPEQKQKPHKKPKSEDKTKPDHGSAVNQYFMAVQEPEPEEGETISLTPKPSHRSVTESLENPSTDSDQDSTRQKLIPDGVLIKLPDQKPKPGQKNLKINQKPKPDQIPGQNFPDLVTGQKTKPNVRPRPDQKTQTNQGIRTPRPSPKSMPDNSPEAESNKTSQVRPLPRNRAPTRPTLRPGAASVQGPKPSPTVQPKPSLKTKADLDPLQNIMRTSEVNPRDSHTNRPVTSGPPQQTDWPHSSGDTEFSSIKMKTITRGPQTSNSLETELLPPFHTLSEDFTMSPNSRITSDLTPQPAGQPPSIPMTTRPNKIIHETLPSVSPSAHPGSTKPKQVPNVDSRLEAEAIHTVQETAPKQTPNQDTMENPVSSPGPQITSTTSSDQRSTNPTTPGPVPLAPDASTPSARELRVKINQVAAFFNNSLSPNGSLWDRRLEKPEGSKSERTGMMVMRDCSDYLLRGHRRSGVYLVTPDLRSRSFPVFCDMKQDEGGWTLLQRRHDGSVSFNRTWAEYRSGFGELDGGEFWLGNNMIHLLTRDRDMVLRVELEDYNGVMEYAEYEQFRVASERIRYRLSVGKYSGTAGDALRFSKSYDHNNRMFTTPDRDHDRYPSGNCGAYYSSGWWFDACMAANLNGRYYTGKYKGVRDGIFWGTWHNISSESYPTSERQSFKAVRMMIRPKGFAP